MPALPKRKRNRLQYYDYSQPGFYFVTICTKGMEEFFGEVVNAEMVLNDIGAIVLNQWLWLQEQYSYVYLDQYVIMPNHIHGIIAINPSFQCTDKSRLVRTLEGRMISSDLDIRKIKSLSELIGAFKTTSSKKIHEHGLASFSWHRSFHDRIIRDKDSLSNIRTYIRENPKKWHKK